MAAATSYDGPSEEQLHAYAELEYADLPVYGSKLAEVFAVRVPGAAASSRGNRQPPCGMIHVFGAYCSQSLIFKRSLHDDPTSPHPCDRQGNLVLTGPERTISADGPISFRIHLHDSSREFSFEENWENGVDLYKDICIYDRPISAIVNTPYGPAEVIYAIMSQGVECKVAVRLARWDGEDPISLFGRIVARSELFDIVTGTKAFTAKFTGNRELYYFWWNDSSSWSTSEEEQTLANLVLENSLFQLSLTSQPLSAYNLLEVLQIQTAEVKRQEKVNNASSILAVHLVGRRPSPPLVQLSQ